ncbi:MAG: family 1 glycosylhydrolase [Eubacteriales bacterium]|nr:family 1 glycosylhydrolase [Eubacteriales bacterium]
MNGFTLKEGMLLGTASAATQIEGGETDHSWLDWAHRGFIADGSTPARADGHYRRWQEDDALMETLGLQIARIGVEWARVEPKEGEYDEEALAHYVREVEWFNDHGIRPLVTLHHFTNPMWFERKGAFEKRENIADFLRFVDKMVRVFGARVNEYITINEPNVYAANGYYFGIWPPGERSLFKTIHVMNVLAEAHIDAYGLIHVLQKQMGVTGTRVSYANHVRVFAPKDPQNILHRFFARLTERFFQGSLSKTMGTGKPSFPIRNFGRAPHGLYCDFIAVNYYTRSTVAGFGDGVRQGVPVNDMGWEIYPQGIVECAQKLYAIHPLPVYITENGTCDNRDEFRCRYLYDHLQALCTCGLPVERYYHWCFTDNFEWTAGESARFGLVHVDYETQQRAVKRSGLFYRDIIAAGGVTEEMYQEYVEHQQYRNNG